MCPQHFITTVKPQFNYYHASYPNLIHIRITIVIPEPWYKQKGRDTKVAENLWLTLLDLFIFGFAADTVEIIVNYELDSTRNPIGTVVHSSCIPILSISAYTSFRAAWIDDASGRCVRTVRSHDSKLGSRCHKAYLNHLFLCAAHPIWGHVPTTRSKTKSWTT